MNTNGVWTLFRWFGLFIGFVLFIGISVLVVGPFYWLYTLINSFVGAGWVSVLIELAVVAGVAYGGYWLVRWLRVYIKRLPDPMKHAERLREERERRAREDES